MWDFDQQEIQLKIRKKRKKSRRRSITFHLTRTAAEIRVPTQFGQPPKIISARLFLNDFTPYSLRLSATGPVEAGRELSVSILDEKTIYLPVKVEWCKYYSTDTTVFTDRRYNFRICFSFLPASVDEMRVIQNTAEDFLLRTLNGKPSKL